MEQIAKLDKNERYYHRTDEQLVQFANWKPEFENNMEQLLPSFGGQLSELDGTEWLYPPGAPSTERCFTEMKTGFLILTGSNRIVRKTKDLFSDRHPER